MNITHPKIRLRIEMDKRTSLTKASSKVPSSLRTTVPMSFVDILNLKEGDELNWELQIRDNKPFLVVTKVMD
jgi:hypothetical protein